jgi:hypothetical protein
MFEGFRLGGFGMFPTLLSGFFLVGAALRYAKDHSAPRLRALISLAFLTLTAGSLATLIGVMKTLGYAADEAGRVSLILTGIYESLHNLALALVGLASAGIIVAVGAWRSSERDSERG